MERHDPAPPRGTHIEIAIDAFPADDELRALWQATWGSKPPKTFRKVLSHGLAHVVAFDAGRLIGFVNVAWDGGIHAFLLDTSVHPDYRRRGIVTDLVLMAVSVARERGAQWVHVDFEPHLSAFYRKCGFRHTEAGLIRL